MTEYAQEEEIECDDGEELEERHRIRELEYGQEEDESSGYAVSVRRRIVMIRGFLPYERDETDLRHRCDREMQDESDPHSCKDLPEVDRMRPLDDEREELILELEDVNVREGKLVEDDTSEIDRREERGEEVEFLDDG